jgi:DNA polymerase V
METENIRIDQVKGSEALPLFQSTIAAGFPSPADDELDQELDLNKHLIKHPAATFFLRVKGNSMLKAGIHDGDIVIVDRSIAPADGKVIIASVDGELTIKRLSNTQKGVFLVAENDGYAPIAIHSDNDLRVWGVVTTVIHPL